MACWTVHCSHCSAESSSCIVEDNVLSAECTPRCPAFHQLALQQFTGMLCSADLQLCCSSIPCLAAALWHRCMPVSCPCAKPGIKTTVGRLALAAPPVNRELTARLRTQVSWTADASRWYSYPPDNRFFSPGSSSWWIPGADEESAVSGSALHSRGGQSEATQGAGFDRGRGGRGGGGGDILPGVGAASAGEPAAVTTSRERQHPTRPQCTPLVPCPRQRLSGAGGEKGNNTKQQPLHRQVDISFHGETENRSRETTLSKAACIPKTGTKCKEVFPEPAIRRPSFRGEGQGTASTRHCQRDEKAFRVRGWDRGWSKVWQVQWRADQVQVN